jgi:ATP synthase protein I
MDIRAKAYRIVAAQLAVTAVVSLGFSAFSGMAAAGSAFAGGLISAAGSLVFARWLASAGGCSPRDFARAFYVGEGLKIVLTVALFWVAMELLEASPAPLLITYAVTLIVYWLALLPGTSGAVPQQRQ